MTAYLGIEIDYSRDNLLDDHGIKLLRDFYMQDGEQSPQEAFARASVAWSAGDLALAQRLYDAASRKWFMFASPVLSNAPAPGKKVRGMPISCFLSYVPDTVPGLIDHSAELRYLSIYGGGVGGHWSDVRSPDDLSPGPMPFLHTVDADMLAYRQGKTRKGSYAAYMDVSHPDILEFLHMRVPTGDHNRKCLNLHNAINITDAFMQAVFTDADWPLIDPHTKEVKEVVPARELWEAILEVRYRTGEPYLCFIDTAQRLLPETMLRKGLKLNGSNLCIEIFQPTNKDRTAVCCLSSLNGELYDEWKDTTLVEDVVTMLDNVIEYFVGNAPDTIARARFAASQERSIGLGFMGWHSLLQQRGVPFESEEAARLNEEVFAHIQSKAIAQSLRLGAERGEAPDMAGTGRRNAMLIALAPNANSASLIGTSPSIEPWKANAFTMRDRAGTHLKKNVYLEAVLEKHGRNDNGTWTDILVNGGSVQHLDFLSEREKAVFKTAIELDMAWVVRHAADRQKFVCQGQSLNLFFAPNADRGYLNRVHLQAYKAGLKGLYYLRTEASRKAEVVAQKVERVALKDGGAAASADECTACHA